jgi:CBS-domain-containing membrane protein
MAKLRKIQCNIKIVILIFSSRDLNAKTDEIQEALNVMSKQIRVLLRVAETQRRRRPSAAVKSSHWLEN